MKKRNLFTVLVLVLCISACSGFGSDEEIQFAPTLGISNPQSTTSVSNEVVVDSLQVSYSGTSPTKVMATIKGYLPESCMILEQIEIRQDEKVFEVVFIAHRQNDTVCEQERLFFEEEVLLPVEELPADVYALKAGENIVHFSVEEEGGSTSPGSG